MYRTDAAYCSRRSTFCGLAYVLGTPVSFAKTNEPINTPRGRQRAQGTMYGLHVGATWPIRVNDPFAAAMRPCIRLLWPSVKFCAYLAARRSYKNEKDCLIPKNLPSVPLSSLVNGDKLSRLTNHLGGSVAECLA